MVLALTPKAREFVANWIEAGEDAPKGCVDQRTLPIAIGMTPGLAVDVLDVNFCAIASDKVAEPVILDDNASRDTRKVAKWKRRLYAMMGVMQAEVAGC